MKNENILKPIYVVIILALLAGGCSTNSEINDGCPVTDVSVDQAFQLVQQNAGNSAFVILDVRSPSEYAVGHIAGAININMSGSDFESRIAALDPALTYLVYCQSGGRSRTAANTMAGMGFCNVNNMTGGIGAWISAGYPVVL